MRTSPTLARWQISATIQLVVEGDGEVEAVPVLLRRFVDEAQAWPVQIGRPIHRPRNQIPGESGAKRAVRLARVQPRCGAILMLFDGDLDCPAPLGPTVQRWAADAAGGVPCSVAIAQRKYEAWFLAEIESLRGHRNVRSDAALHPNPRTLVARRSDSNNGCAPARATSRPLTNRDTHKPIGIRTKLSSRIAYRRSLSFRKLASALGDLARSMGHDIDAWPTPAWAPGV